MGVGRRSRAATSNDVRIGFIGVGGRGTVLLRQASRIDGCRIAAVCDLLTDRVDRARQEAAKQGHKPQGYADFREMIEKEKLDGVIVATEPGNHARVIVPVLEAGVHCFAEKPMDTTVEKVNAIVQAARKAKCIYQIGFQRRYNEDFQKAMGRIHAGDLGKVFFLQGHWHWSVPCGYRADKHYMDADLSGGRLVEQCCHHMDVMSWVMKNQHPIECVGMAAIVGPYKKPLEQVPEDQLAVAFRFPGDVVLSYTLATFCTKTWLGGGENHEQLWVYGHQWGMDLMQGEVYFGDGKPERVAEATTDFYVKGTTEQLEAFCENIRKGGADRPASNIETGRIATLMAIMGRHAFRNEQNKRFECRVVKWEEVDAA